MHLHWTAGIGDPSPIGWFTVAAYLVTAVLCSRAAAQAGWSSHSAMGLGFTERQFWQAMALIFLGLGINKQLDLQSLLTEIGRVAARTEGWYGNRRTYQVLFIEALAVAAAGLVLVLLWIFRRSRPALKLAVLGLTFTTTFVVLRAASFHHVDQLLKHRLLGWRWNWIIELGGIAIVAIAALSYCRQTVPPGQDRDQGDVG